MRFFWYFSITIIYILITNSWFFIPNTEIGDYHEGTQYLAYNISDNLGVILLVSLAYIWTYKNLLAKCFFVFIISLNVFYILQECFGANEITFYPVIVFSCSILLAYIFVLKFLNKIINYIKFHILKNDSSRRTLDSISESIELLENKRRNKDIDLNQYQTEMTKQLDFLEECKDRL